MPPPPAYHEECPPTVEVAQPPKYVATRVVLPTYAQSELYEKEGVMPTAPSDTTDSSSTDTESSTPVRRWSKQSGTCFEFTIFFIGNQNNNTLDLCIILCMCSMRDV